MLTPKAGWVCTFDGRRAAVVWVADTPVLVDGELATRIVLLAAPRVKGDSPIVAASTTADVDVTPGARPATVLIPVAAWLATPRTSTVEHAAITEAALILLGSKAAS